MAAEPQKWVNVPRRSKIPENALAVELGAARKVEQRPRVVADGPKKQIERVVVELVRGREPFRVLEAEVDAKLAREARHEQPQRLAHDATAT